MSHLTKDEFEWHIKNMRTADRLVVDTEGTLTHPHSETWGLSYSHNGASEYFPFTHKIGNNLPIEWLPQLVETVEQAPCLVMHHAKHDLRALRNLGINYTGPFYCTMNMQHWNDENTFSKELDYLGPMYGGNKKQMPPRMKLIVDTFGYDFVPVADWIGYAANDAEITEHIFDPIYRDFVEQDFDGELWNWEQRWTRALMKIEDAGVAIDTKLAEQEYFKGRRIMNEIKKELGFNPASPIELGRFLLDELNLPVLKTTAKKKPCFDKHVMAKYDQMLARRNDKRAKLILTYKGWMKCTGSSYLPYLEKRSPVDDKLRVSYRTAVAVTGRLTAEYLHQIPKESIKEWNANTKKAITTDEGYTAWEFDYSQLEFRLGSLYALALDSKTQKLIDAFNDPSRDVFTEMAHDLNMERDPTKTLNYTMQFGGGINRVSEVFDVSRTTASTIISDYFRSNPGFAKAAAFSKRETDRKGYIKLWTGRRRHFKFSDEHRKAFNSICQGGAFEIVKRSGTRIHEAGLNNEECRMDLTVHDAFRFSIKNGMEHVYIPEIKRIMEDVVGLAPSKFSPVKFAVDVHRWASKDKWVPNQTKTVII